MFSSPYLIFFKLFYSVISQLSVQTKLFSELQGRNEANLHDVGSALIELGINRTF